jgi:hypothetical protein
MVSNIQQSHRQVSFNPWASLTGSESSTRTCGSPRGAPSGITLINWPEMLEVSIEEEQGTVELTTL